MTQAKHTPGPWSVCYYDAGDHSYYDHNGPCPSIQAPEDQNCAIVHWDGFKQQYWSSANGNQREIEANARLIAAAPELLEALQSAEAHFGPFAEITINGEHDPDDVRVVSGIRTAIAKATGEASHGE